MDQWRAPPWNIHTLCFSLELLCSSVLLSVWNTLKMDCWSPTIDLLPPSIRIEVLLLTSVKNAAQIRKALMDSDPRLESIALIKAHLIIDPLQVGLKQSKEMDKLMQV